MVQNNALETKLAELIAPIAAADNLFLEELRLLRAGKHTTLRITVDLPDGPGGITSDQLDVITRAISDVLDEADPIQSEYNLEVSTPGIDRKLTSARHFSRAIGHLAELKTVTGEKFVARIQTVDAESAVVIPEKKYQKVTKLFMRALVS
ncbi:ribosome maturation factor RimP [Arcanobacterium hippocoleae]